MMIPKKGEAVLPHYKHTASQFYGWSCPTIEAIIPRLGAPIKIRMEVQHMKNLEVESGILAMEDVGTVLTMIDRSFIGRARERESMERAFYILKAIWEQRYSALKVAYFGGGTNA